MKKIVIIIVSLYVFLSGCHKKEHYEVTSTLNSPVFHVSGNVDGKPVNLQAGVNNYYMFASHQLDSDNVYLYTGTLKQVNCTTCGPQLQIGIRAYKALGLSPLSIDSSLKANSNYVFQDQGVSYSYKASFQSSFNETAINYSWNFGDGGTSSQKNPTYIYTKSGKYNVCLTIGNNFCQSNICNTEIISNTGFRATIGTVSHLPWDSTVKFTSLKTNGQAPFRYFWKFGDGQVDVINSDPTHTYSSDSVRNVKLMVIDANNDTCFAKYNFAADTTKCAANYTLNMVPIRNLAFGQVNLTWTDTQGNVYNSVAGPQVSGSYFKILSVEDYTPNEKGERSKKLHIQFSGRFYKGSQYITFDNMDAVIAVSYP